jgi:hypothetical protein
LNLGSKKQVSWGITVAPAYTGSNNHPVKSKNDEDNQLIETPLRKYTSVVERAV